MTGKIEEILEELDSAADGVDKVTVGEIMEKIGHRGYGPFLMLPALLELTPAGAIPGVPTMLAIIVALFAAQIALGRDQLWLPDALESRAISKDKLDKSVDKLRPMGRKMDQWFHKRWPSMTKPIAKRIAMGFVLLLCLAVPPLEILPFASSGPMLAIAVFGLALTVDDGMLMMAGYVVALVVMPLIAYLAL
ncbi:exopolysaccharide biosynthesis protein [Brevirhabdus sp.]|uniref:exopolysaccharide biosynthesis protein n=1 Tax=Brevirhabdus sp. TaxID=2004514 RepID=UPI004058FED5